MEQPRSSGWVLAVCRSEISGVPKHPQAEVVVGPMGVEGDYHAGPINRHKKTGPEEPNTRQVSVVAREVVVAVGGELELDLRPGDLAENFLVAGLGDLAELRAGDRLRLGAEVLIEVTGQNRPCATIATGRHPELVKRLLGRRGIVGVVLQTGTVRPGDAVEVLRGAAN